MLKVNPAKITTFIALLALLALVIYFLSDKMIEKGLFTKDTVSDLLFFLLFAILILAGFWIYNNIAEKEIAKETQSGTTKNVVTNSKRVDLTNKSKGHDTSIEGSEDVRVQND